MPWKNRLARVRRLVDAQFGESLRVTPMAGSQYSAAAPDAERDVFTVTAIVRVGEGDETNLDGGEKTSWRARIPVGKAEAHVDPDVYPAILTVKQGDKIEALDRSAASFEVARIGRRQRNRITLRLNEL